MYRDLPDDAEEVDVGVVDGEVDEDSPGASVQPQVLLEYLEDVQRLRLHWGQVLDKATASVGRDEPPVIRTIQFLLGLVGPPGNRNKQSRFLFMLSNFTMWSTPQ